MKKPPKLYKVSVLDEDDFVYFVKACCLTRTDAYEITKELASIGIIARWSSHLEGFD